MPLQKTFSACRRLVHAHRLGWAALAAYALALLYVFLIPPWWHYDEPGHFEFTWALAHFDHWPRRGEFDPTLRRRIAASMLRYDWYRFYPRAQWPHLDDPAQTPFIGPAPQFTPYPLYYLWVSLPLRLTPPDLDPAWQVRIARGMSALLFVATLGVVWAALGEILPRNHRLRWLIPLSLGLLPGFVEMMTAINDDAGAAFTTTLLLWAGLRLARRGLSGLRVAGVLAAAAAAFWTKNTTWPAVALVPPLALYWSLPWPKRRVRGRLLAGAGALLLALTIAWGDPAVWFRWGDSQNQPGRTRATHFLGEYAFQILTPSQGLGQWLPEERIRGWAEEPVTVGLWLWSTNEQTVRLPALCTREGCQTAPTVTVGPEPRFFAYATVFPRGAYPRLQWRPGAATAPVYADGLVLALGDRTQAPPPTFLDASASLFRWGGGQGVNVLRNASAEQGGPWLRPWLSVVLQGRFPGDPNVAWGALLDPQGTASYLRRLAGTLLRTFWGHPARNKIPLWGNTALYPALFLWGGMGLLAALGVGLRHGRDLPGDALTLLGSVLLSIWLMTAARGLGSLLTQHVVVPWARYALPAFFPTLALLTIGWEGLLRAAARRGWSPAPTLVLPAFFLALQGDAMVSILAYFHPQWSDGLQLGLLVGVGIAIGCGLRRVQGDCAAPSQA